MRGAALVIPCTRETKRHIPQEKTGMDCVENGTVLTSKGAGEGGRKLCTAGRANRRGQLERLGVAEEENGAGLVRKNCKGSGRKLSRQSKKSRRRSQNKMDTGRLENGTVLTSKRAGRRGRKPCVAGRGKPPGTARKIGRGRGKNGTSLVSKTAKVAGENRPDSQSNFATGHRKKRVWAARKMVTLPAAKREILCCYFIAMQGKNITRGQRKPPQAVTQNRTAKGSKRGKAHGRCLRSKACRIWR